MDTASNQRRPAVGMKIYSLRWLKEMKWSPVDAAQRLREQGVERVLVLHGMEAPAGFSYDPQNFRQAIYDQGLEYWSVNNQFYDPPLTKNIGNVAMDQYGRWAAPADWYWGACPTHPEYVLRKRNETVSAALDLQPDGIFLGFHRFPGFWETWTADIPIQQNLEYCFCPRCLALFRQYIERDTPQDDQELRTAIRDNATLADLWGEWKATVIGGITSDLRNALGQEGPPLMLNTVPFSHPIRKRYFGQDVTNLASIDVFELMAYHQVLKERASWVEEQVQSLMTLTPKPIDVTIQGFPLYLDGFHAAAHRDRHISDDEWKELLAIITMKSIGDNRLRVNLFEWGSFLSCREIISRK